MVSTLFPLLFAGRETTTHLISGSVRELLLAPQWRDWLEQDRSRIDQSVEEFLRFVSAVQFTKPRFVECVLGGVQLKKGEKIMPMLVAANFDPKANDHPDKKEVPPGPRLRCRNSFPPESPARAHRGQVRAAGPVRAVAEARAGDGRSKPSLAHANRHSALERLPVTRGD
jgi:hypothetical protein